MTMAMCVHSVYIVRVVISTQWTVSTIRLSCDDSDASRGTLARMTERHSCLSTIDAHT